MKRNNLWAAPALAAALWLGGSAVSVSAQNVDAATDAAADATADTSSATATTDSSASATGSADVSTPSTSSATADASTSTDTGASTSGTTTSTDNASVGASVTGSATDNSSTTDDSGAQSSSQAGINGDASISAGAQSSTPPAPVQPGASASVDVDASTTTDPTAQQDAAAGTNVDASIQGDANLRTGAQAGAQQNLQSGLQFGQATDRGLAINTIARDHFFYNSGLRQGDVLVSYAGRPIRSSADFNRWVVYQPGQRVPVVVLRNGRPQTIYVVYQQQRGFEQQAGYAPAIRGAYLGVTFDAQNPQQAVVRTVTPGSPAEQAGIQPGDVIFAVNGNQVGGSQDVIRIVSSMQPGEPIDVAISRQVVLVSRPGVAQAASYSPDVRIQGSVAPQPPAVPVAPSPAAVGSATVTSDDYVGSADADAAVAPGSGRYDNTPARAGDADRDGRVLDGDGRVGPAEGRAILPRRRN